MPRRIDARRLLPLILSVLAVSACGERSEEAGKQENGAVADGLDQLALESGVLADAARRDPAGSYGRSYDGGRDRFCIAPHEEESGQYRFGAEVRIGEDEYCKGTGSARRAGERLILSFAGGTCVIVARYEGDRVVMPGAVDMACARLCSSRGSFAGVTFPLISGGEGAARDVTSMDGQPLCR